MLFIDIILPVFLIIAAGFLLEKKARLDLRTLADSSLYLFAPALVFSALMKQSTELGLALDIGLFMVLYTALLFFLSLAVARLKRMDSDNRSALTLTTSMMNVGNFGLPLTYFAFGEAGLDISVMIFVLFNIPLGTLAIVVAQGSGVNFREALRNTFKIPIFHAVALAFALKATGIGVPDFLLDPLSLLGQAAIPIMLVLLGMQLARTTLQFEPGFLSLVCLLRLAAAPVLAWGLTALLDIDGLPRYILILQTSTPSAVLPLLYSVRFQTRPDLVAGAIFVTTLLSSVTLTIILYLLPQ